MLCQYFVFYSTMLCTARLCYGKLSVSLSVCLSVWSYINFRFFENFRVFRVVKKHRSAPGDRPKNIGRIKSILWLYDTVRFEFNCILLIAAKWPAQITAEKLLSVSKITRHRTVSSRQHGFLVCVLMFSTATVWFFFLSFISKLRSNDTIRQWDAEHSLSSEHTK